MLLGLYLLECATLLGRQAVVLSAAWGSRFRAVHPSGLIGSDRLGLVLGNPLPPLGTAFVTQVWPFSVAPSGWFSYSALSVHPDGRSPQPAVFLPAAAAGAFTSSENRVLTSGAEFVRGDGPAQAAAWAAALAEIRKAGPGFEEEAVRKAVGRALDRDEAARRAEAFRSAALPARVASAALVVYLFAVAPFVVWQLGLWETWRWLVPAMFLLMWTAAFLYFRAHRVLYPAAAADRWQEALRGSFFAPAACRYPDYLARPLMAGLHPLAVAHALLGPEDFLAFARRVLLDARQPALPEAPREAEPAAGATESWFRGRLRTALEDFVRARGLDPEDVCAPPQPRDGTSRSYCPRCDTQFAVTDGVCDACGGMPLRLLPAPAAPGA